MPLLAARCVTFWRRIGEIDAPVTAQTLAMPVGSEAGLHALGDGIFSANLRPTNALFVDPGFMKIFIVYTTSNQA